MTHQPKFGITTVSQLTGISKHLLRIWEQRYDIIDVSRTETGRRMYSEADCERLLLIKYLVDRGEAIGKVAKMSDAQLQKTVNSLRDRTLAQTRLLKQEVMRVAVLGDFLPSQLESARSQPERLEFVTSSTSMTNFRADIRRLRPQALVIELAVFNRDSEKLLFELKEQSGAEIIVVVYGFGRREELDSQRAEGIRIVRFPCSVEEIYEALLREPLPSARVVETENTSDLATPGELTEIPARRFEVQELARLANASSTVECECPSHLVDLVISLNAFEAYSAACENRNDKDAAIHAYLHATTAKVRATLEDALERVARSEGLLGKPLLNSLKSR